MGDLRERMRVSKTQRLFCADLKIALQKWAVAKYGREIPVAAIYPSAIAGVRLLEMPVPPMLEEALGYRGDLRFVEFGYCPRTRQFGYGDGGDDIPSNPDLWLQFLRHPAVAPYLPESRYPTLYGVFPRNHRRAIEKFFAKGSRGKLPTPPHRLLLDRQKRQLYLCRTDHTTLFFGLTEPECKERIIVDGLLMDPASRDYKEPPPKEVAAELLGWLDSWLKPTPTQVRS
jgi:hypothetical protein